MLLVLFFPFSINRVLFARSAFSPFSLFLIFFLFFFLFLFIKFWCGERKSIAITEQQAVVLMVWGQSVSRDEHKPCGSDHRRKHEHSQAQWHKSA